MTGPDQVSQSTEGFHAGTWNGRNSLRRKFAELRMHHMMMTYMSLQSTFLTTFGWLINIASMRRKFPGFPQSSRNANFTRPSNLRHLRTTKLHEGRDANEQLYVVWKNTKIQKLPANRLRYTIDVSDNHHRPAQLTNLVANCFSLDTRSWITFRLTRAKTNPGKKYGDRHKLEVFRSVIQMSLVYTSHFRAVHMCRCTMWISSGCEAPHKWLGCTAIFGLSLSKLAIASLEFDVSHHSMQMIE